MLPCFEVTVLHQEYLLLVVAVFLAAPPLASVVKPHKDGSHFNWLRSLLHLLAFNVLRARNFLSAESKKAYHGLERQVKEYREGQRVHAVALADAQAELGRLRGSDATIKSLENSLAAKTKQLDSYKAKYQTGQRKLNTTKAQLKAAQEEVERLSRVSGWVASTKGEDEKDDSGSKKRKKS